MPVSQSSLMDVAEALRPRLALQDGVIVVAIISAATLFAFEYDFFSYASMMTTAERRVTVQECFALTGLLIVSLIGFSFYRLRQQKREYQLRIAAELTAREALHEALHDALTGLANRRALLVAVGTAFDSPTTAPRMHALMLLDLDGFKTINDTHGHAAGDEVLRVVAQRLRSAVDVAMIPARLGGDEFAIWCPDILTRGNIRDLTARLLTSIRTPIRAAGTNVSVGASAGVAFYPHDAETEAELFRCADAALYRSKAAKQPVLACEDGVLVASAERRARR
jgi:diguanylate cyclase (GGDEF)-like protein